MDSGSITELSHEKLKIQDSLEISTSENIPLKINDVFLIDAAGEITSSQMETIETQLNDITIELDNKLEIEDLND